ncbi:hypothetical protein J6590_024373 [Homalodisca vitripennis]|nr:hypothetical protein J6590_024373 [Homalodisca vitripennis]
MPQLQSVRMNSEKVTGRLNGQRSAKGIEIFKRNVMIPPSTSPCIIYGSAQQLLVRAEPMTLYSTGCSGPEFSRDFVQ